MEASLVILDGYIITMDPNRPYAEALAVKDSHIFALGTNDEISYLIGTKTKVINAQGKVVLPGFIDCHVHLMQTGIDMMKIDMSNLRSIREIKDVVNIQVKKSPPGQWIMGTGYNEFDSMEERKITLEELDLVAPNNPVWISRVDHHSGIVNTLGYRNLNIPGETKGIERNNDDEKLTGYIFGQANSYARQILNKVLDNNTRRAALKKAAEKMLSVGITSVHALEGGSLFSDDDVDVIQKESNNLPIGIKLFYQTTDVNRVLNKGLKQIGGCLLMDGSIGSRTAALSEPYSDAPEQYGNLYFDSKELEEFVLEAHIKGLQITTHAIGDAAIEQMLRAYEKAFRKHPRVNHRHRIEHFSLPSPTHIERCIKEGIVLSVQPAWGKKSSLTETVGPKRLGEKRSKKLYPLATPFLAGAKMCAGSDSPISPVGPILGIHGSANHFRFEERLSRISSISLYTTNAAWAGFEDNQKGKLSPGYGADIVILNDNIFSIEDEHINNITIFTTIVQGVIRYQNIWVKGEK